MEKGSTVIFPVSRKSLIVARRIALRQRIWFKTLSGIERAQVDLTIKVVQKVQSTVLKNILRDILQKLKDVVESQISRLTKSVGRFIATKLSLIAISWGYSQAKNWSQDQGFIQFLTINHMHTPTIFKE
jgi:hypothetical protein